jgi:hypothetical protein
MMRMTLKIDDDVLEAARRVAAAEGRTLGKVVSELARRGLPDPFPVFEVPPDAPPITLQMVKDALDP